MQLANPIFLHTVFVCCPLSQSSDNRLDIPDLAKTITQVEDRPSKQHQEDPEGHEGCKIRQILSHNLDRHECAVGLVPNTVFLAINDIPLEVMTKLLLQCRDLALDPTLMLLNIKYISFNLQDEPNFTSNTLLTSSQSCELEADPYSTPG